MDNLNLSLRQFTTCKSLKIFLSIFLIFILTSPTLSQKNEKAADEAKTGWNFGILPAISWDNDLGFQYGGLINLYQYGDGSRYPLYDHSIYLEASAYTKGSGIFRFMYDSDKLIKNIGLTVDVSYIPNQAYNFFGFDGYEALYNQHWEDDTQPEGIYKTRVFYRFSNKMFRFKADVNGKIKGKLKWLTGIQWYNFDIGPVDIDKLNKGKDEEDKLPALSDQPTLYDKYVEWGLIPEDEAGGGTLAMLKGGLMYDSRDNKPNPMHGLWTEISLEGAPEALGSINKSYLKLSFIHRQYFTIVPNGLSFAARLAMQTTVSGHAPFYIQNLIITSMLRGATEEGLGGVRNLRGIPRNRVVGDGVAYANFELRWKFYRTRIFNQNFYFGLNTFLDAGQVIKKLEIEKHIKALDLLNEEDYFDFGSESLHLSYGLGLRIAMNQNFILAIDYGRAVDKRDGNSGFYVGLNYLF